MAEYTIKLVGTFEAHDDAEARYLLKSWQENELLLTEVNFDVRVMRHGSSENIMKRGERSGNDQA